MSTKIVTGMPDLGDHDYSLRLRSDADFAFISARQFMCCVDLRSAETQWVTSRECVPSQFSFRVARRITAVNADFWLSVDGLRLAKIAPVGDDRLALIMFDARSGSELWSQEIEMPDDLGWPQPADIRRSGCEVIELVTAFFAQDTGRLVVCQFRHVASRKSTNTWESMP